MSKAARGKRTAMQLTDLDFHYGDGEFRLQLDRLSITEREQVAIIGPSGSGKTTLLHIVAGIVLPQCGTVMVDVFLRNVFRWKVEIMYHQYLSLSLG